MNITQLTIGPPFGRDYKSGTALRQDWRDGFDFVVLSVYPPQRIGRYVNIRDVAQYAPHATVLARYNSNQSVTILQEEN